VNLKEFWNCKTCFPFASSERFVLHFEATLVRRQTLADVTLIFMALEQHCLSNTRLNT